MRKTLLAGLLVLCVAALVSAAAWLLAGRGPARPAADAKRASPHDAAGHLVRSRSDRMGGEDANIDDDPAPVKHAVRTASATRAAPVWTVDKAASRLSFRGVMNGVAFDGVFRDWDAQIAFDPKNLTASHATVTVDTASALTGEPIKDQALPNAEWLATDAYPQATLVTHSIAQTGAGHYQATAEVRIRGVAWRTSVPFIVQISGEDGRMEATLGVDRRTFGIGEGPFRSPAPVEPMVQVSMKLIAKKDR